MGRQHLTEALPAWREERAAFYEEHFGKTRQVVGGKASDTPKIDVHVIGPDEERADHSLLVTNGLSDHWMEAPPAVSQEKRRVELILYCPGLDSAGGEAPMEMGLLAKVGQMGTRPGNWLGEFKAMPVWTPAKAIAPGSKLTHAFLIPPMFEDQAVNSGLELSGGERVTFLWVDFLTMAEFNFRMGSSGAVMLKKFQEKEHSPVLEVMRESYV